MSDTDHPIQRREKGSNDRSAHEFDVLFEVLSNRYRRLVLHRLEEDETVGVDELAREVDVFVDADPPRITTRLHHVHLPKMDRIGILDYDPRTKTVRYYGNRLIEEALEHTPSEDFANE